jgi:hypothetical protein
MIVAKLTTVVTSAARIEIVERASFVHLTIAIADRLDRHVKRFLAKSGCFNDGGIH